LEQKILFSNQNFPFQNKTVNVFQSSTKIYHSFFMSLVKYAAKQLTAKPKLFCVNPARHLIKKSKKE